MFILEFICFIAFANDKPSFPGILMSRNATSISCSRQIFSAFSALSVLKIFTSEFKFFKTSSKFFIDACSSSTINALIFHSPIFFLNLLYKTIMDKTLTKTEHLQKKIRLSGKHYFYLQISFTNSVFTSSCIFSDSNIHSSESFL